MPVAVCIRFYMDSAAIKKAIEIKDLERCKGALSALSMVFEAR